MKSIKNLSKWLQALPDSIKYSKALYSWAIILCNLSGYAQISTTQHLFVSNNQQKAEQQQQIMPGETPTGISSGDWQSILRQMEMGKYKAYRNKKGGYETANPANGFHIEYSKDGSTVMKPYQRKAADFSLRMRLSAVGYAQPQPVDKKPAVLQVEQQDAAQGSKVTYQWTKDLSEWWVNDEGRLEQWFQLNKSPNGRTCGEPLRLRMGIKTDLDIRTQPHALTFSKGNTYIQYDKFKAWDASGKQLNCHFEKGDGYVDLVVADAGAVYPLTIDPSIAQQAYIKASNTEASDQFGRAVAISGNTIVIGAPGEDSNATGVNGNQANNSAASAGAAYVFVRTGTTWTQQAYLKASNTEAGDIFGVSVAISNNTIVVGAFGESSGATGINGNQADNSATTAGAAYVFFRSGTTWTQQAYLKASNTNASDQYAVSVAIDGDYIVVGANLEDSNATGVNGNQADNSMIAPGAAYVYFRSGTTWTQQAYLKASNPNNVDFFGQSVAISGATIVVGAYQESSNATGVNGNQADNSSSGSGAAYVFVRSGTTWSQQAYLKASNTGANHSFGFSVDISGNTIVVGASGEGSNATGVNGNQSNNLALYSGAAYVFFRSGTTWTQQAYLKASNTDSYDGFGFGVDIDGDIIAVVANKEDSNATGVDGDETDNSAVSAGAGYVFIRSGTTWTQLAYLKASNAQAGDEFGGSVNKAISVSGNTVVISVDKEDSNATGINGNQADNSAADAGAAFVFVLSPQLATTAATCTGTTVNNNAQINVTNATLGIRYGYSTGHTYAGPAYASATAYTGASFNITSLPNPSGNQVYTVRVFYSATEYVDRSVILPSKTCQFADLSVTSSPATGTGNCGETQQFTVTVTNNGTNDAPNPTVSIPIPSGTTFLAANPSQGSYDAGTKTWTLGSLANAASATITISVQIN